MRPWSNCSLQVPLSCLKLHFCASLFWKVEILTLQSETCESGRLNKYSRCTLKNKCVRIFQIIITTSGFYLEPFHPSFFSIPKIVLSVLQNGGHCLKFHHEHIGVVHVICLYMFFTTCLIFPRSCFIES